MMIEIPLKRRGLVYCDECAYLSVQNTKYLYAICQRHGIEFKPFEDDTRTHYCAWGVKAEQTEPQTHDIRTETHGCVKDTHDKVETMSCQECKWWFTDSLKHGGYCQSLLYNHECRYEPEVDCSWK